MAKEFVEAKQQSISLHLYTSSRFVFLEEWEEEDDRETEGRPQSGRTSAQVWSRNHWHDCFCDKLTFSSWCPISRPECWVLLFRGIHMHIQWDMHDIWDLAPSAGLVWYMIIYIMLMTISICFRDKHFQAPEKHFSSLAAQRLWREKVTRANAMIICGKHPCEP